MPNHHDVQHFNYTPEQLFILVADVQRYPEFLPWCKAARISGRTEDRFMAELVISYKGLSESYTSQVTLTPHSHIDVVMIKGPFEHLTNRWHFTPENGGTRVEFWLDFKFRSRMLEMMMGSFFSRASAKMVDAFQARAEALYGKH